MSMVAFPFKAEDPAVVRANLRIAADHPAIDHVLAVGAADNSLFRELAEADATERVQVILQDRHGSRRPGKGDGMNTAMRRFLDTDLERLHFYDADITNFDRSWIDGAEAAADRGHDVVRHFFPRASTDAMVTWMITRPVFALTHPRSVLWRIRQPLGGELLLTRGVVERLVDDPMVTDRSDWGIDTVLTYASATYANSVYEHYVPQGKQHALYGSLNDLREMVYECFEAAAAVGALPALSDIRHEVEPEGDAPPEIAYEVGYDAEASLQLLVAPWSAGEKEAAHSLPSDLIGPLWTTREGLPAFAHLDGGTWGRTLAALLAEYRPEPGWRALLFRLWVGRVLAYTTSVALGGHAYAMRALESTVAGYASGDGEQGDRGYA